MATPLFLCFHTLPPCRSFWHPVSLVLCSHRALVPNLQPSTQHGHSDGSLASLSGHVPPGLGISTHRPITPPTPHSTSTISHLPLFSSSPLRLPQRSYQALSPSTTGRKHRSFSGRPPTKLCFPKPSCCGLQINLAPTRYVTSSPEQRSSSTFLPRSLELMREEEPAPLGMWMTQGPRGLESHTSVYSALSNFIPLSHKGKAPGTCRS